MPNSLSKIKVAHVIKVTKQDEDIILHMENIKPYAIIPSPDTLHQLPKVDANITLDYFEARSLAYTILAMVCHIEKDMLLCDCGREKNCVCPICEDDS